MNSWLLILIIALWPLGSFAGSSACELKKENPLLKPLKELAVAEDVFYRAVKELNSGKSATGLVKKWNKNKISFAEPIESEIVNLKSQISSLNQPLKINIENSKIIKVEFDNRDHSAQLRHYRIRSMCGKADCSFSVLCVQTYNCMNEPDQNQSQCYLNTVGVIQI